MSPADPRPPPPPPAVVPPGEEHERLLAELLASRGRPGAVEARLTRLTQDFHHFLWGRQDALADANPEAAREIGLLRAEIDRTLDEGDYRNAEFDEHDPRNAVELLLALWRRVERKELGTEDAVRKAVARRNAEPRFRVFGDWYDLAENLRQKADLAPFAGLTELMARVVDPSEAEPLWLPDLAVAAAGSLARAKAAAGDRQGANELAARWAAVAEQSGRRRLASPACGLWLFAGDGYAAADKQAAESCYRAAERVRRVLAEELPEYDFGGLEVFPASCPQVFAPLRADKAMVIAGGPVRRVKRYRMARSGGKRRRAYYESPSCADYLDWVFFSEEPYDAQAFEACVREAVARCPDTAGTGRPEKRAETRARAKKEKHPAGGMGDIGRLRGRCAATLVNFWSELDVPEDDTLGK